MSTLSFVNHSLPCFQSEAEHYLQGSPTSRLFPELLGLYIISKEGRDEGSVWVRTGSGGLQKQRKTFLLMRDGGKIIYPCVTPTIIVHID